MEIFLKAETWLALLTLTFFEVVLGIDNIIFISIVSNRLPIEIRARTRNIGLVLAMGVRIVLLLTITWVMKFTEPLFAVPHWISEDSVYQRPRPDPDLRWNVPHRQKYA
jgi:predicted tellurium resistance membrane protein TerC